MDIEIKERNKGELNVFTKGYLPLSYWRNWFTNIGQFFRNIKYAWQRATKGYCDRDTWSLDTYYLQLFYHTLKYLAKNTNGWPGKWSLENKTYENWQQYLSDMADHFENAQEWNEEIAINKEIFDMYNNMSQYIISSDFVPTDETKKFYTVEVKYSDEEAYNKTMAQWLKKEEEAAEYRENEKDIALDMLKAEFFDLWD